MVDRRTFLITCGGVIAVPAVAHFGLASAAHVTTAVPSVAMPAPALRIHGWDSTVEAGDICIQINGSWRATWR